MFDYLIVGAGLYGAVTAHELTQKGYKCLVIDKRNHIGGNIYTRKEDDINVHVYGAHIFHTSDKKVWDYVNDFADFNNYINSPVAAYHDETYNLPFNMNTFSRLWGIRTPDEAKEIINSQIKELNIGEPSNLEEQALKLVGRDVYEKLIKGYTEKQWGRPCNELPAFIIKRLPLRFTYNNNYFNDRYQGIPIGGYTAMVEKLLEGVEVKTETDYFELRRNYFRDRSNPNSEELGNEAGLGIAQKVIFTGRVDEFFNHCLGKLEYRSLRFETEKLEKENYQGCAVVNYTAAEIPFTRIIEHKHFEFGQQPVTIITREYPEKATDGAEPYYPINNERNNDLYSKYEALGAGFENLSFGGRLGTYKYYDMDKVIAQALAFTERV